MNKVTTLEERIHYCVDKVGTQIDFVRKSDISRSQLTRYLDGNSQPTISKLMNIANVSGMDLGWLVTGMGSPCKDEQAPLSFSYDLMQKVIEVFEETLMEHPYIRLTPHLKSIILPLIQAEAEHEKNYNEVSLPINKTNMVDSLEFLTCVNKANMITHYKDSVIKLLSTQEGLNDNQSVGNFVNTACKASIDSFSMEMGEHYCQRTKDILNSYAKKSIYKIMETLFSINSTPEIKMLDIGCGSGRFMEYIHKNYERIKVQGIEPATLAYETCKSKEMSGSLPKNSVLKCDARDLPYESGSIDFVLSKAMLHWVPYFKNYEYGAHKVFQEVSRVLKKGGSFYFDMRHNKTGYREYIPFNQTYSRKDVQELATKHGFKIMWIHIDSEPHFTDLVDESMSSIPDKYKDFISVYAVKL